MTTPLRPGLLVLQGNRLELLAEAVFGWLHGHPLRPIEEEVFLVQSNGMAEWLKMEIASSQGITAASRVELPARFIWRAYRTVLGPAAVPPVSALDKLQLTWRLMRLLPGLAGQPGFEALDGFLGSGGAARRLDLAQRLADLFDQYQVHRSDWLGDWAEGRDRLGAEAAGADGQGVPVPADQRWQPALWRALLADLSPDERQAGRALLHRRFIQALGAPGDAPERWPGLPRRIVLFGTTHIPHQTLEALAALSTRCQVLMAVPNPCRYHWADIIDGRELLRAASRRQPLRGALDLAGVPLHEMHAHGHPLLAAWGRQARDFVRQLDEFDDVQRARRDFDLPRIDLFDDGDGRTLLEQVQARIRDLVPLAEHPAVALPPADRSIVFHRAHSAQREVEILHDQLLHLFAHPPGGRPLQPRDVVVMVPDIETFAPAIRSVFGQHARGHPRQIPWGIADQRERGHLPLLVALEWLLRAPQQRFTFSEVRDLLDVPAVARRFGIDAADLPALVGWIDGAGVRWGLHAAQRETLGLGVCGETNTWHFGLRRMLLGYAAGDFERLDDGAFAGIEPFDEVAGLDAGLAGSLAEGVQRLDAWWSDSAAARPPAAWARRLRLLLAELFAATDEAERALLVALDAALSSWLEACEGAGFDSAVDLAVVRETWLQAVDTPGGSGRFKAGGVTFCTLLPMRAIPFEVVCLLGMNEADYPRRGLRADFDLMALPGLSRPGDRSRRDDDRQLMLDALLSARRVLYLSWVGRSQRDNQEQPASVLVSQLRDYLARGWGQAAVDERTTDHPLQPFSRRYFEQPLEHPPQRPGTPGLFTYASEWRAAHVEAPAAPARGLAPAEGSPGPETPLTIDRLASFMRNPVKAFFRHRLRVSFDEQQADVQDDEDFVTGGLDQWQLLDEVLRTARRRIEVAAPAPGALAAIVESELARLARAGRLPIGAPGRQVQGRLAALLVPMLACWRQLQADHPVAHERWALRVSEPEPGGPLLDDWLRGLRSTTEFGAAPVWIDLQAGRLADRKVQNPRPDRLALAWVRCLASAACGWPVAGWLVGTDVLVRVVPPAPAEALAALQSLMRACDEGLRGDRPLPTALLTGLTFLEDPDRARLTYEGSDFGLPGEGREACLARLYPDFATLAAAPGFAEASRRLYAPYREWLAASVHFEALPGAVDPEGPDDE